jgi:hypothetical protein
VQLLFVEVVDRAVPVELRADGMVYFRARHRLVRDAARRELRLADDGRRVIAFVRHADEGVFESERADDLGGRRQQRDDARCVLAHRKIYSSCVEMIFA